MPKSHRSQREVCSCTPVLSERSLALETTGALLQTRELGGLRQPASFLWLLAVAARAEVPAFLYYTPSHPQLRRSELRLQVSSSLTGRATRAQPSQTEATSPFKGTAWGIGFGKPFLCVAFRRPYQLLHLATWSSGHILKIPKNAHAPPRSPSQVDGSACC